MCESVCDREREREREKEKETERERDRERERERCKQDEEYALNPDTWSMEDKVCMTHYNAWLRATSRQVYVYDGCANAPQAQGTCWYVCVYVFVYICVCVCVCACVCL